MDASDPEEAQRALARRRSPTQIETGRNRIPSEQLLSWAKALKISQRHFGLILMRFYDPDLFALTYQDDPGIFESTDIPDFARLMRPDDPVPEKLEVGGRPKPTPSAEALMMMAEPDSDDPAPESAQDPDRSWKGWALWRSQSGS